MKLTLYKLSQRSLDESVVRKQIGYAVARALGGNRGKVWSAGKPVVSRQDQESEHLYSAAVSFKRTGRAVDKDTEARQFDRIKELAERAVRAKGWTLNGEAPAKVEQAPVKGVQAQDSYAVLAFDKCGAGGDHFAHLFGVDPQIQLVLSAVEEYQRSQFSNRFHCVLYGEPACGKTEILRSLTRMLGNDAVMHFDATSTTAAGAKQLLTESSHIPPVLCIEEIEKADEISLRWLLGVLDYRAEVRALKYRAGLVSKEVKLLCLATVNDFAKFNHMMDGALASRFSHKVYCPRPSHKVLERILQREITKSNGDVAWIKPALKYCTEVEKTNDPRRIITVCLCGKERLLTGEYQMLLSATRPVAK